MSFIVTVFFIRGYTYTYTIGDLNIMSFIVTVFFLRGLLLVEGTEKHRRVLVGLEVNKLDNLEMIIIASMLRSMSTLPMTLSLVASFMSAITLLGVPAEIYTAGTQFVM